MRAFFNVCRHRGTRLCEAAAGRFPETIQCPYHAWTYATDGRLVGAPHMHEVEGFDKRDHSLHPASLASWHGFLFLNLSSIRRHWKKRWPRCGAGSIGSSSARSHGSGESITRSGPTGS